MLRDRFGGTLSKGLIHGVVAASRSPRAAFGANSDVCFGSLADILTSPRHVRFTPNNGRWAAHPSQYLAVGLFLDVGYMPRCIYAHSLHGVRVPGPTTVYTQRLTRFWTLRDRVHLGMGGLGTGPGRKMDGPPDR